MIKAKLNSNKEKLKSFNSILFIAKYGTNEDRELVNSLYGIIEETILQ